MKSLSIRFGDGYAKETNFYMNTLLDKLAGTGDVVVLSKTQFPGSTNTEVRVAASDWAYNFLVFLINLLE